MTLATGFGGSSTASLTKAGSGALILTGSDGYSGGTTINSGTLQVGNPWTFLKLHAKAAA